MGQILNHVVMTMVTDGDFFSHAGGVTNQPALKKFLPFAIQLFDVVSSGKCTQLLPIAMPRNGNRALWSNNNGVGKGDRLVETVQKCSGLNHLKKRNRELYDVSVRWILKNDPGAAKEWIFPAMGAYRGQDYHFLLHDCLKFYPSVSFVETIYDAYPDAVRLHCSTGADSPVRGGLPLHFAMCYPCRPDVVRFLLRVYPEAALQPTTDTRELPLHIAVKKRYTGRWDSKLEILDLLVKEAPSSLMMRSDSGHSPADVAVMTLNHAGIDILVKANPDAFVNDSDSNLRARGVTSCSPLEWACSNRNINVIRTLLLATDRAGPNVVYAACSGQRSIRILSLLLESNNDVLQQPVSSYETVLDYASWTNPSKKTMEFLLSKYQGQKFTFEVGSYESRFFYRRLAKVYSQNHPTIRHLVTPSFAERAFVVPFLDGMSSNETVEELDFRFMGRESPREVNAFRRMMSSNRTIKRLHCHHLFRFVDSTRAFLDGFAANNNLETIAVSVCQDTEVLLDDFETFLQLVGTKERLRALTLTSLVITSWDLEPIPIHDVPTAPIIKLLESKHHLTALHLSGIELNGDVLALALALSTKPNPPLESLTLSACMTMEGCNQAFVTALGLLMHLPSLRKLNVSNNMTLTTDDMVQVAESLKTTKSLEELNLSYITLTATAIEALTRAVREHNMVLRHCHYNVECLRELDYYTALNRAGRERIHGSSFTKEEFVNILSNENQPKTNRKGGVNLLACSVPYGLLRMAPHLWAM